MLDSLLPHWHQSAYTPLLEDISVLQLQIDFEFSLDGFSLL